MKRIGGASSGRIWYETAEIEQITADALRAAGLMPACGPAPIDIESFVEMHLGAQVDYAGDLTDDILGYTEFSQPPRIVVSRRLTDLAMESGASLGLRGRWRATLAHEAAHILLHAKSRGAGKATPKLTAQAIDSETGRQNIDWREVQANMGMAALLMPRTMFLGEARRMLEGEPRLLPFDPASLQAQRLVTILAECFETSHEATRLRLMLSVGSAESRSEATVIPSAPAGPRSDVDLGPRRS